MSACGQEEIRMQCGLWVWKDLQGLLTLALGIRLFEWYNAQHTF